MGHESTGWHVLACDCYSLVDNRSFHFPCFWDPFRSLIPRRRGTSFMFPSSLDLMQRALISLSSTTINPCGLAVPTTEMAFDRSNYPPKLWAPNICSRCRLLHMSHPPSGRIGAVLGPKAPHNNLASSASADGARITWW